MRNGEPILQISFNNTSDIPYKVKVAAPFDVEGLPLGQTTFPLHEITVIILKAIWKYPEQIPVQVEVSNIIVSPEEALKTMFMIVPGKTQGSLSP